MQFFIPMSPQIVTHQDKKIRTFMRGGKPCAVLHDSERLKAADGSPAYVVISSDFAAKLRAMLEALYYASK